MFNAMLSTLTLLLHYGAGLLGLLFFRKENILLCKYCFLPTLCDFIIA